MSISIIKWGDHICVLNSRIGLTNILCNATWNVFSLHSKDRYTRSLLYADLVILAQWGLTFRSSENKITRSVTELLVSISVPFKSYEKFGLSKPRCKTLLFVGLMESCHVFNCCHTVPRLFLRASCWLVVFAALYSLRSSADEYVTVRGMQETVAGFFFQERWIKVCKRMSTNYHLIIFFSVNHSTKISMQDLLRCCRKQPSIVGMPDYRISVCCFTKKKISRYAYLHFSHFLSI